MIAIKYKVLLLGLVLSIASGFALYGAHRAIVQAEVKIAIEANTASIRDSNEKELSRLREKVKDAEKALKTQIKDIEDKKDAEIKASSTKYVSTINWLRKQLAANTHQGGSTVPGTSEDTEDFRGQTIQGLPAESLRDIAELAKDANELKENLKSCYASWDAYEKKLIEFKEKSNE